MPIDYTHQHLSTSIMQADEVHTPIDPAGGGVTVDNGGSSAAVSEFVVPGALVTAGSADLSSLLTYWLGPFTLNFNDPGMGPAEDGIIVASLTAGSLVLNACVFVETAWNGDNIGTPLLRIGTCRPGSAGSANAFVAFKVASAGTQDQSRYRFGARPPTDDLVTYAFDAMTPVLIELDTDVAVFMALDNPASQGQAIVYVQLATPAA